MKNNYTISTSCLFLLCLLVSGCTTDVKDLEGRVLPIGNPKAISELIGDVTYLSLYNDTIPFSGRIDKIMSKGDTLFIFDAQISKSLRAYTKDGQFLYSIGTLGRGKGEYVEMANFTIDNNYFYCIDNAKKSLLIYDNNNGDFVKQLSMPSFADDLELFDNGDFIFYRDGEPGEGRVFITDENLNPIDEILQTTKDDYCFLSTITAFSKTEDQIIFSRYAKDEIVLFDRNDYKKREYLTMDFGDYTASIEDKIDDDRLGETKYLIPPVYMQNNLLIGNINVPAKQQYNDFWRYGSFVYDLKEGQIYSNILIEELLSGQKPMADKFMLPLCGVIGNQMVTLLDSYVRYDELLKLGFPPAPAAIKKQFDNGETLLVLYTLKH